jgi:hypothetical protein
VLTCGFSEPSRVERAAGPRVERPARMAGLPGSRRLFPVVSGPRAESVLIPGPPWSRPIGTARTGFRSRDAFPRDGERGRGGHRGSSDGDALELAH